MPKNYYEIIIVPQQIYAFRRLYSALNPLQSKFKQIQVLFTFKDEYNKLHFALYTYNTYVFVMLKFWCNIQF